MKITLKLMMVIGSIALYSWVVVCIEIERIEKEREAQKLIGVMGRLAEASGNLGISFSLLTKAAKLLSGRLT